MLIGLQPVGTFLFITFSTPFYNVARAAVSMSEHAWFPNEDSDILGTVIRDPFDKDWSIVILGKNEYNKCVTSVSVHEIIVLG